MTRVWTWVCVVAMAATAFGQGGSDRLTPETFKNLQFRTHRAEPHDRAAYPTSRSIPKNANVWYVAVSAGNLWKTENRGNTWTPIFETYGSYSLGAVVVDPQELQRRLAGDGREQQPAQRQLRRRHLQVDRCRRDLDAHGPRELRAHSEHPHRSARLERRLRERDWPALERRAATAACTRRPTAARPGRPSSPSAPTPA